jgi:hypothetical protein
MDKIYKTRRQPPLDTAKSGRIVTTSRQASLDVVRDEKRGPTSRKPVLTKLMALSHQKTAFFQLQLNICIVQISIDREQLTRLSRLSLHERCQFKFWNLFDHL